MLLPIEGEYHKITVIEGKEKYLRVFPPNIIMLYVKKKLRNEKCKRGHKKSYYISSHGNCVECATLLQAENVAQLKTHQGVNYEKWKEGFRKFLAK